MSIPKSDKLAQEDSAPVDMRVPAAFNSDEPQEEGPLQIRRIDCLNDYVAILQSATESNLAVPDSAKYKNEGIVVGVGPGLNDGNGGRLAPCVDLGDSVLFSERNILTALESDNPPYNGKRVIIVSERNIICKLPHNIDWVPYA